MKGRRRRKEGKKIERAREESRVETLQRRRMCRCARTHATKGGSADAVPARRKSELHFKQRFNVRASASRLKSQLSLIWSSDYGFRELACPLVTFYAFQITFRYINEHTSAGACTVASEKLQLPPRLHEKNTLPSLQSSRPSRGRFRSFRVRNRVSRTPYMALYRMSRPLVRLRS